MLEAEREMGCSWQTSLTSRNPNHALKRIVRRDFDVSWYVIGLQPRNATFVLKKHSLQLQSDIFGISGVQMNEHQFRVYNRLVGELESSPCSGGGGSMHGQLRPTSCRSVAQSSIARERN